MSYQETLMLEIRNSRKWKRAICFGLVTLVIPLSWLIVIPMLFQVIYLIINECSSGTKRILLWCISFAVAVLLSLILLVLAFSVTWFILPLGGGAVFVLWELLKAILINHQKIPTMVACSAWIFLLYGLYINTFSFLYVAKSTVSQLKEKSKA